MTHVIPEIPNVSPERVAGEILPFDPQLAMLEGVQYGASKSISLATPLDGSDELWRASITESRYGIGLPGMTPRPHEDVWLRELVHKGNIVTYDLGVTSELGGIADKLEALTLKLAAISGMEGEAVSLRAIAANVTARRKVTEQEYLRRINDYIESRKKPYWVIVDTQSLPGTELLPDNYVEAHKLAELASIHFTDEGRVRTVLRQSDGTLGYVEGSGYLYR